jgi:hypothetical protein
MTSRIAVLIFLLLALAGCSKLTLENYNKIEVGMHYDEVTRLIGAPKACDDVMGLRSCAWGDEQRSATVTFAGDKVLVHASRNLK